MGIYNRDYLREPSGFGAVPGPSGGMVKKIVIATVVVFVVQLLVKGTTDLLAASFEPVVYQGQVWRLITYAFCHDPRQLWHILFNMWIFWILARDIEAMYGSRELLLFYLVAALFAGVCYLLLGFALGNLGMMLGASGAVTAVTMLYTMHYPRRQLHLFGIIAIEMRWIMGFMIVWDLYPMLLEIGGNDVRSEVAHSAHLGGALFGWLYFRNHLRIESLWQRLAGNGSSRLPKRRRKDLKIFQPPEPSEDLAEQMDRVLAKISEHGEESLTERERDLLNKASRKIRSQRGS